MFGSNLTSQPENAARQEINDFDALSFEIECLQVIIFLRKYQPLFGKGLDDCDKQSYIQEAILKLEEYKTGATASAKQKPQSTVFESGDEGCFISNKSKAALPHAP